MMAGTTAGAMIGMKTGRMKELMEKKIGTHVSNLRSVRVMKSGGGKLDRRKLAHVHHVQSFTVMLMSIPDA
jgi:hypothetical protein